MFEPFANPRSCLLGPKKVLENKEGDVVSIAVLRSESQKEVSLKVNLHNYELFSNAILELGVVREMARVSSLMLPYAGA